MDTNDTVTKTKQTSQLHYKINISSCCLCTFNSAENGAFLILENADNQCCYSCTKTVAFTGKERDSETGYSYFGARYYDSDLSGLFLSVDPMSDKYPSLSPYAYCAWNPVKLMDPDGDSIRNAYEMYRDISNDVDYYEYLINNTQDENLISAYRSTIQELREKNSCYEKVNELLSTFKEYNMSEYNNINNISYNGSPIDVYICLNQSPSEIITGAIGETKIPYLIINGNVVGIENRSIIITLYSNAFNDGFKGVGTLANEFGDVLFGIQRPDYNYNTNNIGLKYGNIPTTRFSYDYEQYIISRGASFKPSIFDY